MNATIAGTNVYSGYKPTAKTSITVRRRFFEPCVAGVYFGAFR